MAVTDICLPQFTIGQAIVQNERHFEEPDIAIATFSKATED